MNISDKAFNQQTKVSTGFIFMVKVKTGFMVS